MKAGMRALASCVAVVAALGLPLHGLDWVVDGGQPQGGDCSALGGFWHESQVPHYCEVLVFFPQPGDTVAVLAFRDPVRRNQICWAAIDALGEQLRQCRESGARVVVLASGLEGHWLEHAWLQDLLNGVQGLEQTGTGAGWFSVLQELAHE